MYCFTYASTAAAIGADSDPILAGSTSVDGGMPCCGDEGDDRELVASLSKTMRFTIYNAQKLIHDAEDPIPRSQDAIVRRTLS